MGFQATHLLLTPKPTTGIGWSHDGSLIAVAQQDQLGVWDSTSGAVRGQFTLPGPAASRPSFGPTSDKVACTLADGTVCLWSIGSGVSLPLNTSPEFRIRSIEWAPDGSLLAGVMADGQIGIWDSYSGGPRRRLRPLHHTSSVLAWSADSRYLASAGEGRSVSVWEAATGALKRTLEAAPSVALALAWSPDARLLAIGGGDDCRIQVTELSSRLPVALLEQHQSDVGALSFSFSGGWLASKSLDGLLTVWNCSTWRPHGEVQEGALPDGHPRLLEFCPARPVLASCDTRLGQLALYELEAAGGVERLASQQDEPGAGVIAAEAMTVAPTPAPPHVQPVNVERSAPKSVASLPIRIFLSYAREDRSLKETLRKFLRPLERAGMVSIWDDRDLLAGAGWDAEILQRMREADVFLMLITAAALASDYIVLKELEAAMTAYRNQQARVIPILFESCAWKETALRDLQALPRDARPVTSWEREDEAYQDIVEGIQAVITDIVARRAV